MFLCTLLTLVLFHGGQAPLSNLLLNNRAYHWFKIPPHVLLFYVTFFKILNTAIPTKKSSHAGRVISYLRRYKFRSDNNSSHKKITQGTVPPYESSVAWNAWWHSKQPSEAEKLFEKLYIVWKSTTLIRHRCISYISLFQNFSKAVEVSSLSHCYCSQLRRVDIRCRFLLRGLRL